MKTTLSGTFVAGAGVCHIEQYSADEHASPVTHWTAADGASAQVDAALAPGHVLKMKDSGCSFSASASIDNGDGASAMALAQYVNTGAHGAGGTKTGVIATAPAGGTASGSVSLSLKESAVKFEAA